MGLSSYRSLSTSLGKWRLERIEGKLSFKTMRLSNTIIYARWEDVIWNNSFMIKITWYIFNFLIYHHISNLIFVQLKLFIAYILTNRIFLMTSVTCKLISYRNIIFSNRYTASFQVITLSFLRNMKPSKMCLKGQVLSKYKWIMWNFIFPLRPIN